MCPAAPQRKDVMNLCRFGQPAFFPALLTQRVRRQEPYTYPFPLTACIHFPCCLIATVPVVLSVCQFLMLFAVPFFRQSGTAGVAARSFGFPWQYPSPPGNVVYNIACCRMLCRNPPMLFTRCHLVRCCTCLYLVDNIDTFTGIEKTHGRFALPRAAPYFHFLPS